METTRNKILSNTFIQFIGKGVGLALGILTISFISRSLGVEGFGRFTTIITYLGFFGFFLDLGLYLIIVKHITERLEDAPSILGSFLVLKLFLFIVLFVVMLVVLFFLPYDEFIRKGILIASFYILFISMMQTIDAYFQSKLIMLYAVISDVAQRLVFALIAIAAFVFLPNVLFVSLGLTISTFIAFFISWLLIIRMIPINWHFDWSLIKPIIIEALPIGLVVIITIFYFKVDMLILSFLKGNRDVGIYGGPYKIIDVLTVVPWLFTGNVFSGLVKNKEQYQHYLQRSIDFMSLVAWPILAIIFILARPIMNLLLGSQFVDVSTVNFFGIPATPPLILQVLIFFIFIYFFDQIFRDFLIAFNLQKKILTSTLIVFVANLILNFIFVPKFSYVASGLITVFTGLISLFLTYYFLRKDISFTLRFSIFFKSAFAALIMGTVLFVLRHFSLLILLPFGGLLYCILLLIFRVIDLKEIRSIFAPKGGD